MNKNGYIFTSESVTEGHPDKMADRISDTVLDAVLTMDPAGRVACETVLSPDLVFVSGEIGPKELLSEIDVESIVRSAAKEIGYKDASYGFNPGCEIINRLKPQSGDISMGVDKGGAGDQGMMFGYACDETPELMPLPITLAHKLAKRLANVRKKGTLPYLRPDGKTQVTVKYDSEGKPVHIEDIVVSTQHERGTDQKTIHADVREHVINAVIKGGLVDGNTRIHINPTGSFEYGGPAADAGLTGRKIIVDTYGGAARHGGGAFSGKDPTKVDRSAAYMMRYVAKNIVAAGIANRCEVWVAYAIGEAEPIGVFADTFGTGKISDDKIVALIKECFNLEPLGIIETLNLRRPIYKATSAYGHFGRTDIDLPWEKTDMAALLKEKAGL